MSRYDTLVPYSENDLAADYEDLHPHLSNAGLRARSHRLVGGIPKLEIRTIPEGASYIGEHFLRFLPSAEVSNISDFFIEQCFSINDVGAAVQATIGEMERRGLMDLISKSKKSHSLQL